MQKPQKHWTDAQLVQWLRQQGKNENQIKSYLNGWHMLDGHK